MSLRWNGELGYGKIHMTAREYVDHHVQEEHEKKRQLLRKISNNPALADDVRDAVRYAVFILEDNVLLRKICADLREQIENMKKGY